MDLLLNAIYQMVLDQHSAKVNALASRIRHTDVDNAAALKNYFATAAANKALDNLLEHWQRVSCTSEELAGLIVGASYGYLSEKERERVELVWTGPDLNQFPVRRSEQVLMDIINSANESLFIVSFVLINIPMVESAIKHAVDRGVDVRMLLESEDKENSGDFLNTVVRLHKHIPGIMLYVWPRANRESLEGGFARVHAKCAVADKTNAFVTSANLTSAALDKNIEMGVQINGGSIPYGIYRQLTSMISAKEIVPFAVNQFTAKSSDSKPSIIPIDNVSKQLGSDKTVLVSFKNEKLDIEEVRAFTRCDSNDERPKANSVVLICHESKILVGKYVWSKQQDIENKKQFYLVSVRGFGTTQNIRINEEDWGGFMPLAMENKQ